MKSMNVLNTGAQTPTILFNFFYKPNFDTIKVKGGQRIPTTRIEEFVPSCYAHINKQTKSQLPWIQMFNNGARFTCADHDPDCPLEHWNGCVYMDLDSKAYQGVYAEQVHSQIDDFIQSVADNLSKSPNFYFAQKSISGNSAHFIFYFDTDNKVRGTFERCALYATSLIKEELLSFFGDEVGGDVLNTPGVLDPCNEKPAQPLFMCSNPIVWRKANVCDKVFGWFDPKINEIEIVRKTRVKANTSKRTTKKGQSSAITPKNTSSLNLDKSLYNKNQSIDDVCKDGIGQVMYDGAGRYHWTSDFRPNLVRTIRCFLNVDDTYTLACRVYDQEARFSKRHKDGDMQAEMQKAHEDIAHNCRSFDPACDLISANVQRNIVDELAAHYNVCLNDDYADFAAFRKEMQSPIVYNKEMTLKHGQEYIVDHKDDILDKLKEKGNVLLVADCGTGKSFFFRELMKTEGKVIIISHLNSIKYGVYQAELDDAGIKYKRPTDRETTEMAKKFSTHRIPLPDKLLLGWNQAGILFEAASQNDELRDVLRNYIKCYDECHNLITTVGYRNQQICDLHKGGFINNIYATGTPAGEHNVLGDSYKYHFKSDKEKNIRYSLILPEDDAFRLNVVDVVQSTLNNHFDTYDNILVYSNINYRKIANVYGEWDGCLLLNKDEYEKGGNDIELVLSKNVLTKKLILMTTFGSEGIEFKNNRNRNIVEQNGEQHVMFNGQNVLVPTLSKVLVMFPIESGLTTQVVTQVINRYRDVDNIDVMFVAGNNINNIRNDSTYFNYIKNTFARIVKEEGMASENGASVVDFFNKHYTHYLQKWCMVPAGYMSQCDVVLKNIIGYHNYLICNSVVTGRLKELYKNGNEDIDIIESDDYYTDFEKEVYAKQKEHINILLMRYPQAFTHGTSLNARELYRCVPPQMSEIVRVGESTGNETMDFFLNPPMQYELPLYYSFAGKVNDVNRAIQNMMLAFGADAGGGSTNIPEFYDNNRKICDFVEYLLVAFSYDQTCHFMSLIRFVESWDAMKDDDVCIKETGTDEAYKRLRNTYNKQCARLGFTDKTGDLTKNMFEGFGYYVARCVSANTWRFDQKTGEFAGKNTHKNYKFYLLTDRNVTFKTIKECHTYLMGTLHIQDVPFEKFKTNNKYKKWFGRL